MFLIFNCFSELLELGKLHQLSSDGSGTNKFFEFSIPGLFQKQSLFSSAITNSYDKVSSPALVFSLLLCKGSIPNVFLSVNPEPNENQFDIQIKETLKGVRQVSILGVSSDTLHVSIISSGPSSFNLQLGESLQNNNGTLIEWGDSNTTSSIFKQSLTNFYEKSVDLNNLELFFYTADSSTEPVMSSCFIENNYKKQNVTLFNADPNRYLIVDGLVKNSQYLGFLMAKKDNLYDVFIPVTFYTLNNEECTLIYGGSTELNFCKSIARTVPNPTNGTVQSLVNQWETFASTFMRNFTQILNAFDCNVKYSMVRNCTDCSIAYSDWICRQIIPRCVRNDAPAPPKNYRSNRWVTNEETVFQQNENAFSISPDRSNFTQVTLKPYRKALKCISFCQAMVQSCPTFYIETSPYKLLNCPENVDLNSFGYATC